MLSNQYGQIIISEEEALAALYSGKVKSLENVYIDDPDVIIQYNQARLENADRIPALKQIEDQLFDSLESFDQENQEHWFMPEEYQNYNIVEWLYKECHTDEQKDRVTEELKLFVQHNMITLLKYLKYLVDTMRKNNIVWGVGRGSSVASYVLFLIGIHRIDSIKYGLDIHEFLK